MGQVQVSTTPHGSVQQSRHLPRNMSEIFVGLDTVHVYIDDLLHVKKGSWIEHLTVLEEMFTRLQKACLKVNARKSCFGAHKVYHLVYYVTRDGVIPITKKVEAIQALAVPKTRKIASVHQYDQILSLNVAKTL